MKNIKILIKQECANFNYDDNSCYPLGEICRFYDENNNLPRCKYFENGVLPLESDLEYQYREERKMSLIGFQIQEYICERCKKTFTRTSEDQKYCKICKPIMEKQKSRPRRRL